MNRYNMFGLSIAWAILVAWFDFCSATANIQTYFPMDVDDAEYFLSARKGGSPSAIIEDIKRGQEGVLVKLRQVSKELSDDELKLNNIFYKLGHHDTELKSVNNFVTQLSQATRRAETKMNKQAFNMEFLTRQITNVQKIARDRTADSTKMGEVFNSIHNLEDKLKEATSRLKYLENKQYDESSLYENKVAKFAMQPALTISRRQNDQGACWKGWTLVANKCYYISAVKQTFHQAVVSCYGMKGNIASLIEAQHAPLTKILSAENTYWTSATDIFNSHQWTFLMSGRAVEHSMWAQAERSRLAKKAKGHCAIIGKSGLLSVKCNEYKLFICEQRN